MNDFEMVFRGAVHRFLRKNGYPVDRVIGVVPDTEKEETVILYSSSEDGGIRHLVWGGTFGEFIGDL